MALASSMKLGPYEILAPLGAGGMGEVYRAKDTRLDRTVAIKVLASHLSSSPDLKQRFEREARMVSSLSHAHICQLFDVGSQDGIDYLVMEFLEGETLAERLRKGPVPLNELLKIGIEVAEALQVAHCAEIIHRDLKPGNIMLTKSGTKLMDFGLAKPTALGAVGSGSAPLLSAARTTSRPSPVSPLTTAGSIVGTIQYMSPEQIEGKDADARSDIFAFGAVLYEMATGRRAFEGKSQLSVASAILEKEPEPIGAIKPLTPPAFEHVVRRALEKNPDDRWQSASDMRGELHWVSESGFSAVPPLATRNKWSKRKQLVWFAAALGVVAAVAFTAFYLSPPAGPAYPIRAFITAPENISFVFVGDAGGPPVLSPDGRNLAFVAAATSGAPQIYVRPLDALDARVLAGTDNAWAPFWSPDGRKVGFFADGKLKTIDIQGGGPVSIADAANGRGGSWSSDGTIVFAPTFRDAIYRVPASGGTPVAVTKVDESKQSSHRWPYFLPDGKHFLYLAINHQSPQNENDAIYYASVDGKQNIRLEPAFTNPEYAAGSLLYVRDSQLVAQAFDAASGKLKGEQQQILTGASEDSSTWRGIFTVSSNGILAYSGDAQAQSQMGWYDRTGKQLGKIGEKFGTLLVGGGELRLSPSGDRVAFGVQGSPNDIWVMDLARGVRSRLTFGPTENSAAVWSPDGKWIVYQTLTKQGNAIVRRPAGGGSDDVLLSETTTPLYPRDWSRDGKYLLYSKGAVGTLQEIWALPFFGDRKPFQVVPSGAFYSSFPQVSPDGHWVMYQSNESGRQEIYVVPFREGEGKWQVSTAGGTGPRWRSDGKEVFYISLDGMLTALPVMTSGSQLKLGAPHPLFRPPDLSYDVAPGGQKFLLSVAGDHGSKPITLVVNWTAELKK